MEEQAGTQTLQVTGRPETHRLGTRPRPQEWNHAQDNNIRYTTK